MNVMIDIETLCTRPSAVVLTVGLVEFDNTRIHNKFYYRLCVDEQLNKNRTVDEGTMQWWSEQNSAVQEEALGELDRTPVDTVLDTVTRLTYNADSIWGQGYGFDMTILENLFQQYGRNIPWNFWKLRDSRTIFDVCKVRLPKTENKHNALDDAVQQTELLQGCLKTIGYVTP